MVMEMSDVINHFDVTHFRYVDDIFTLSRKRIIKFCKLKRNRRIDATWVCITRADALDEYLLQRMRWAGCREVHIGVESGSQRVLDLMNKQTTIKVLEDAIWKIKDVGIVAKVYLMYGFPREEDEDREKTLEFIKRTKPDKVTISRYAPSGEWFYPDEDENYNAFKKRCIELCE